jgi:phage tail protein X
MQTKLLHCAKWLALPAFLGLATFASAQSSPTQKPTQDSDSARAPDRDINRDELARFDQFLDSHREIAEQLRKNPALANDRQFLKNHLALQNYLQDHPQTRDALKDDPNIFMKDEARFERFGEKGDNDANRRELANFDHFLDNHRETAQQLRRDPSLIENPQYLKDHPELQTYLQDHPAIRQQIKDNPDAFMRAEDRYDRAENSRSHDLDRNDDRARDRDHGELVSFNQFLDTHHETGEQLRKNPSLADNQQFLKEHPALQSYLQDHPAVREQLRQDPNAFMQREARYDRREGDMNRDATYDRDRGNNDDSNRNAYDRDRGNDSDRDRDAHRHFGEFLGNHGDIAQQLSKDPSLVKKQDYLQDHPELQEYLNQHPEVQQPLMADPQGFVSKSTQQFNSNGQPAKNPATTAPATSPTGTPKPNKQ